MVQERGVKLLEGTAVGEQVETMYKPTDETFNQKVATSSFFLLFFKLTTSLHKHNRVLSTSTSSI